MEIQAEGLSADEVEARQKHYGPNTIKSGKETNACNIFLRQIASPLVYVLLAAMVVTVAIQHWVNANVTGSESVSLRVGIATDMLGCRSLPFL